MKRQRLPLWLLTFLAVGCAEQQDQTLPFDPEPASVTRTVPVAGGFVSTPAGASIEFPAGAFGAEQSVTLAPQAVPAALSASGRAVSPHAFAVSSSAALALPARAEVSFRPAGDSAWLASLASVSAAGVVEHADTRVDVSSGIASAPLAALGTVAVVIPPAGAVFPLSGSQPAPPSGVSSPAAAQRLLAADSLVVSCGGPADRCDGLSIRVSDNLLGRVRRAAVVYPTLQGTLRLQDGQVVGSVRLSAAFRAELAGGMTAENVRLDEAFPFRVAVAPAGSLPAFSRFAAAAGESVSLYVPETGSPRATVRHDLQIPGESGEMESASIEISFPFAVHQ